MKNFLEIAIMQINAPCPEKIDAKTLIACIKRGVRDKRWAPHVYSFLEELHVSLIHDIVLSGVVSFKELTKALDQWECFDGPTTNWIREMAELTMETADGAGSARAR